MLQIKNLRVELDAEMGVVRAIDGMDLVLRRGQTLALVGESGCGKSMTALALMRLLPENGRVAQGEILLDEQDLLGLPESAMRSVRGGRIGMIFQEPSTSLNPVMKVGDQIIEAIETHTNLRGPAARTKAIEWLRKVGIPEPERRIDDYPFRMSGGQKQRVMIAITLAGEPDFIVADEPTTALDVTIQAQVLDLLKQLQAETGMGLMLITHDLTVVSDMAHHVALMYAGQVIEQASAADFFGAPKHPYAQALLRALPDSTRRSQRLAAIPGTVPALNLQFSGCRFAPRCTQASVSCSEQVPELWSLAQGIPRSVRCWMHAPHGSIASNVLFPGLKPSTSSPDAQPVSPPTQTQAQAILDVRELGVHFPIRKGLLGRPAGYFKAVDGVSFQVETGKTLALVGESGCGKTTTGKAIVQLLRGQASITGEALLNGESLFGLSGDSLRQARQKIQIIFQDPFASLNPRMRVMEILEEGLLALQPELDVEHRRSRLLALADQVGIRPDALERYPHEFSGGQRQRIAIARALAVQPKVIVCDEPTSALDVSVQAQILNLLKDLQKQMGLSYLFITHNMAVVEYLADEIVVMKSGRVVEHGNCQAVMQKPADSYTRSLIAAVPKLRQFA